MNLLSLIILILILGVIILVHELGHFFWAKKYKVHIYEFSIGMGPIVYSKLGKDNIKYNVRAIPIGGFVQMAGEVYEDDNKIPLEAFMCNKKWYQRIVILASGVINNFILAIIIFFSIALIWGGVILTPKIKTVLENHPFAAAGVQAGDTIEAINGYKVRNWDSAQIILHMKDADGVYEFKIKDESGNSKVYNIEPKEVTDESGKTSKVFGIEVTSQETKTVVDCVKYAFVKFQSIIDTMSLTIYGLFSGKIGLNSLAGPVGMYQVVDSSLSHGLSYMLYLTAFLSINVGFINILPFPAFDGGRIIFLIIEKIKGSPINSKVENAFHLVGFAFLILLMIYVAIQDIIRLF